MALPGDIPIASTQAGRRNSVGFGGDARRLGARCTLREPGVPLRETCEKDGVKRRSRTAAGQAWKSGPLPANTMAIFLPTLQSHLSR